jgi:putative ABC transport system permease protein
VRERRRDLAIVKCLGMRRGQVARAVGWQATTIALFGVAVGVPSGLILGRVAFAILTDSVTVPTQLVLTGAILAAAAGAVVVANLAAAGPAIVAARTRPAAVLNAE